MGQESRRFAEERFDVVKINAKMIKAMGLNTDESSESQP